METAWKLLPRLLQRSQSGVSKLGEMKKCGSSRLFNGGSKPRCLKAVLTWQELLSETSMLFKPHFLPSVLEESEAPTFPHTAATPCTPRAQPAPALSGHKNLISQEGGDVRGTAGAAGESSCRGMGSAQDPLPCARRLPQAAICLGTIPTAPQHRRRVPELPPEQEGQGSPAGQPPLLLHPPSPPPQLQTQHLLV